MNDNECPYYYGDNKCKITEDSCDMFSFRRHACELRKNAKR